MPVAQPQQGNDGKMGSGRFAANGQFAGAKSFRSVFHQPQGCGLAIVGAGRIGMFRRQTVLYRDCDQAVFIGNGLQAGIVMMWRAKGPATSVKVQICTLGRALRPYHTKRDHGVSSGDFQRFGARAERWDRKWSASLFTKIAHNGRRKRPLIRQCAHGRQKVGVEGCGFV